MLCHAPVARFHSGLVPLLSRLPAIEPPPTELAFNADCPDLVDRCPEIAGGKVIFSLYFSALQASFGVCGHASMPAVNPENSLTGFVTCAFYPRMALCCNKMVTNSSSCNKTVKIASYDIGATL